MSSVGRTLGDGLMVEIDHGGGVVSRYAHCQRGALVKEGDQVDAGTVIATVGSSGLATVLLPPTLIVVNGKPVDPLKYLLSAHDSSTTATGEHVSGGSDPRDQQPQH